MSGRDRDRDRDRPKKSWREVDAQRDRSRSPTEPSRQPGPSSSDRASKQYRAALDALFAKGEVGKLAEKLAAPTRSEPAPPKAQTSPAPAPPKEDPRAVLRKKILAAVGRDEISRAVDR